MIELTMDVRKSSLLSRSGVLNQLSITLYSVHSMAFPPIIRGIVLRQIKRQYDIQQQSASEYHQVKCQYLWFHRFFSCGSVIGNTIERAQDSEKEWNEKSYHWSHRLQHINAEIGGNIQFAICWMSYWFLPLQAFSKEICYYYFLS